MCKLATCLDSAGLDWGSVALGAAAMIVLFCLFGLLIKFFYKCRRQGYQNIASDDDRNSRPVYTIGGEDEDEDDGNRDGESGRAGTEQEEQPVSQELHVPAQVHAQPVPERRSLLNPIFEDIVIDDMEESRASIIRGAPDVEVRGKSKFSVLFKKRKNKKKEVA